MHPIYVKALIWIVQSDWDILQEQNLSDILMVVGEKSAFVTAIEVTRINRNSRDMYETRF